MFSKNIYVQCVDMRKSDVGSLQCGALQIFNCRYAIDYSGVISNGRGFRVVGIEREVSSLADA